MVRQYNCCIYAHQRGKPVELERLHGLPFQTSIASARLMMVLTAAARSCARRCRPARRSNRHDDTNRFCGVALAQRRTGCRQHSASVDGSPRAGQRECQSPRDSHRAPIQPVSTAITAVNRPATVSRLIPRVMNTRRVRRSPPGHAASVTGG